MRDRWEALGEEEKPSWYLDPLVARQKGELYQRLIREWTAGFVPAAVLKTDLFEEAYGQDHILFDLFPTPYTALGLDFSVQTVRRAKDRHRLPQTGFFAADVRKLPVESNRIDFVVSTSTLDHFDSREELDDALAELARVLQPGGRLIVALDNPVNPLYFLLRWLSRRRVFPFPLGHTRTRAGLARSLREAGLEVRSTGVLIHNPRIVSTLLFLALRRLLGRSAEGPIRVLLGLFALMDRLPTRGITACFVAACAEKPGGVGQQVVYEPGTRTAKDEGPPLERANSYYPREE
jgi:SAM-dependent methyltransferase